MCGLLLYRLTFWLHVFLVNFIIIKFTNICRTATGVNTSSGSGDTKVNIWLQPVRSYLGISEHFSGQSWKRMGSEEV